MAPAGHGRCWRRLSPPWWCGPGSGALRFLVISMVAAAVQLLLYLTVHPLLFTVIFERMIGDGTAEPTAFAIRVVFYMLFGVLIATVSLIADYTRITQVVDRPATVSTMI